MGTENGSAKGYDNPSFQNSGIDKSAARNGDVPGPAVYDDDIPEPAVYSNGVSKTNKVKPGEELEQDDDVEKEKQARRDMNPLKFISFIVNHTGACFGITLALHILMIVITIILVRVDYNILPFELGRLPLEIRDDVDFLRETAWLQRNHEDNKIIERGKGVQGLVQPERTVVFEFLSMLFEKKEGNVFTAENLKAIKAVEDELMTTPEYKDNFCFLSPVTSACTKPTSVIRYFDGSYAFLGLPEDLEFKNISGYLYRIQQEPKLRRTLETFLGKDAAITSTSARSAITRSMLPIGGPLKDYKNLTHDADAQEKKYEKFFLDEIKSTLDKHFKDKVGPDEMGFYYLSSTVFVASILSQVQKDMILAIGSFAFITIFMMIQTGSVFVTLFSVLSIITGFFGSNLLYRCVFDYRYLGIFHGLALFIILGIGADDVFIFMDTWKDSAYYSYKSLAHRLSDVYRRASVAMLFTSMTTAVAFFVSATSPFLGVSSFGVFAGILICFNYISVISYIPCVVLMYHRYFEKYRCCCCCPRADPGDVETVAGREVPVTTPVEPRKKGAVVRFLSGPYFRFVTHKVARWFILVFFAGVLATFIYFASQLRVNEDQIKFFKETTNVAKYLDRNANAFSDRVDSARSTKIYIVFGMKEQDLTSCHKTDAKCTGKTVWDDDFSLEKSEAQHDLLEFCNELKTMDDETATELRIRRSIEDGVTLEVDCFIEDMKNTTIMPYPGAYANFPYNIQDWENIRDHRTDIYTDTTFTPEFKQYFTLSLGYWINDQFNGTNKWKRKYEFHLGEVKEEENTKNTTFNSPSGGREVIYYGTRLRYAAISVNTTIRWTGTGYDEGLKIRDKWEDWVNDKLDDMASKEELNGFQTTEGFWHWLKVQQKLVYNAVLGIVIGLCVALPILTIATHNILIGILATLVLACITISVIGVIPLAGWKLGLLESLNLVLVVGLSVDYVVHLAEGYARSAHKDRLGRVRDSLEEVGISVLSGACTTLGASFFMLFAIVLFFTEFGIFMFSTIGFSISYALGLFITMLGMFGPEGETGSLKPLYRKISACCCRGK